MKNQNPPPFTAASVPETVYPALVMEILITLQASVTAIAMTLCDIECDIARLKEESRAPELAWDDYQERRNEEILAEAFHLNERFPPKA
jgi:hypothetical protein